MNQKSHAHRGNRQIDPGFPPYPTNFVPHPIYDSRFTASQAVMPLFAAC